MLSEGKSVTKIRTTCMREQNGMREREREREQSNEERERDIEGRKEGSKPCIQYRAERDLESRKVP